MKARDVTSEMRVLFRAVGALRAGVTRLLATLIALMSVQPLSPTVSSVATGAHEKLNFSQCPCSGKGSQK